jgi:hypothetical protein
MTSNEILSIPIHICVCVCGYTQSVGLLGREKSRSKGLYLHTEQHKHSKTHTDIHASSGIRTHDSSVSAGEGSSCLTSRGQYDRPKYFIFKLNRVLKLLSGLTFTVGHKRSCTSSVFTGLCSRNDSQYELERM